MFPCIASVRVVKQCPDSVDVSNGCWRIIFLNIYFVQVLWMPHHTHLMYKYDRNCTLVRAASNGSSEYSSFKSTSSSTATSTDTSFNCGSNSLQINGNSQEALTNSIQEVITPLTSDLMNNSSSSMMDGKSSAHHSLSFQAVVSPENDCNNYEENCSSERTESVTSEDALADYDPKPNSPIVTSPVVVKAKKSLPVQIVSIENGIEVIQRALKPRKQELTVKFQQMLASCLTDSDLMLVENSLNETLTKIASFES